MRSSRVARGRAMPFEPVETPIPSPDSFGSEGDAATLSAAAALLVLGLRLRGDDDALEERARDALAETDALHPEDAEALQVPQLGATGVRIDPAEARALLSATGTTLDAPDFSRDVIGDVAGRFQADPTHLRAAVLFEACLRHPEELVRVAAASAYLDLTTDPGPSLAELRKGVGSEDE